MGGFSFGLVRMGNYLTVVDKSLQSVSSQMKAGCHEPAPQLSHAGYLIHNRVLGRGEYSTVYHGTQSSTGRQVAVKTTRHLQLTATRRKGLESELFVLRRLQSVPSANQHFVMLHEALTDKEGSLHIVTDFIAGCELFHIASKHPCGLPEEMALRILRQVFLSVELLHQHDIAHRDLKLENIMYDQTNKRMRLIDFGFAVPTVSTQHGKRKLIYHNKQCGSLHYVAPEIVRQVPYDASKVDVWALGVLTATLLTGEFPFDHADEQQLFDQILSASFSLPPSVSPSAKSFIRAMLHPQPNMRPTVSSLLSHPWWKTTRSVS